MTGPDHRAGLAPFAGFAKQASVAPAYCRFAAADFIFPYVIPHVIPHVIPFAERAGWAFMLFHRCAECMSQPQWRPS